MQIFQGWLPAMCATAALMTVAMTTALANAPGDTKDVPRRDAAPDREAPPARGKGVFKVYEWGVTTQHWSGGPDTRFDGDVPAAYYDDKEVPVSTPQPDPDPDPRPDPRPDVPRPRKPVVYFECGVDLTFSFQVTFKSGRVTWMYPKPSLRSAEGVVSWDNIHLRPDVIEDPNAKPLPGLLEIPVGHWANYSRDGSTSSIAVNGEHERFLFYEGEDRVVSEVDVVRNDKGQYVIRNYSAWPVYDFGARLGDGKATSVYIVAKVPAAQGDRPGEVVVTAEHRLGARKMWQGILSAQCEVVGLTVEQATVFDRCWRNEFFTPSDEDASYWYRRDQGALDDRVALKVTLPATHAPEFKRVGYVYVHGADFDKTTEFDGLVTKAVTGDADATDKLKKGGVAALGALRRALLDTEQPLKKRIELARLLKTVSGTK